METSQISIIGEGLLGWKPSDRAEGYTFTAKKRNDNIYDLYYKNGFNAGYCYKEVCGFFVLCFSDPERRGFFEAWQLRAKADILDYLNKE